MSKPGQIFFGVDPGAKSSWVGGGGFEMLEEDVAHRLAMTWLGLDSADCSAVVESVVERSVLGLRTCPVELELPDDGLVWIDSRGDVK